MIRRLLALAVIIGSILLFVACNKELEHHQSAEKPSISLMVPLNQAQPPKEEMIDAIEKMADVHLNIEWVPYDIYQEKMINSLETNTLKNVMFVNQQDYILVKNEIKMGEFWEIGPYLKEYLNLKELDKSILSDIAVDDKTYGLYAERPSSRQGIIIRKDWLENLKLKEPGTLDELYEVLRQFTENDPDRNGLRDTIGLTDRNDLVFGAFKTLSSYYGTPNNWAFSNDKLVPEFKTAEYVQTMNFMKRLYNEKLLNTDFVTTSKQIQRYMLISGEAGVYIGSMADAPRLSDEMKKLNPQAELTVVNRIQGPKGYGIWSIPSYSGVFLFSKRSIKTEGELRQILAFFDRTMDTDISNLLQHGIEGTHYTLENGQVVTTPAMNQLRDVDVLPLFSLMVASLGNPHVRKVKDFGQDPLISKVNQLIADNEKWLIDDPTQDLTSPTYDDAGSELAQIVTKATYNYIIGKIDLAAFQKEINTWGKKGGDQINREYEQAYRRKHSADAGEPDAEGL